MGEFVIHALSVGDGIVAIAPMPGSSGDYAADLEHMGEWAPAFVISMTTRLEMVADGVEGLGAEMQKRGARWIHLPVGDFGVPEGEVARAWPEVSERTRAALRGGGRVLIHCKGGCGRSGMVALRLMVESGEKPEAALQRLRAVRPCAVETEAQYLWAARKRK